MICLHLLSGYEIPMCDDVLTGLRTTLYDAEWKPMQSKLGVENKALHKDAIINSVQYSILAPFYHIPSQIRFNVVDCSPLHSMNVNVET